jgi:hypothetical protein
MVSLPFLIWASRGTRRASSESWVTMMTVKSAHVYDTESQYMDQVLATDK